MHRLPILALIVLLALPLPAVAQSATPAASPSADPPPGNSVDSDHRWSWIDGRTAFSR